MVCRNTDLRRKHLRALHGSAARSCAGSSQTCGYDLWNNGASSGSLHGKVYRLPYIEKLPDYESFNSVGDLYTYTLQIKPQVYREEYPGPIKRDTWFGIDYRGTFWIRKAGSFQFFLRSDDGAKLYIDEAVIIDNDGLHQGGQIRAGQVRLTQGLHRIRIAYFQGPPNSVALELAVRPPGAAVQVFDTRNFSPPSDPGEPSLQTRPKK